ncbi:purine-nucleoside phosphorylase, partial [Shewanella indica]
MAAHANGAKGDFAKTVIMPGDSWWANYIAEHFLDDAREVISVRNMLGYTGSWQGKPVSVMGH